MNGKRILGLILVVFGILIILGNLGLMDIEFWPVISTYWPVVLILAGIYNLLTNPAGKVGGVIVLLAGVFFLLRNLESVDFIAEIGFWPVALILLGIWLLLRGRGRPHEISKDSLNTINIFSGSSSRVISQDFRGGSSISLFGGADIDLREAKMHENSARFDIFAMFGGDDIYVPENWRVIIKGLPIFGGWDDNTGRRKNSDDDNAAENMETEAPTLIINCLVIFGGVDVNN